MKNLLFLLSLLFVFSCSSNTDKEKKDEITEHVESLSKSTDSETLDDNIVPKTIDKDQYLDKKALKKLNDKLKGKYDGVLFYSAYNNQNYYYVVKGTYNNIENKDKTFTIGILNDLFEEIVPVEFDKIYNIGTIRAGTVVVEKNGLRGLYALSGKKLVETKYDALYPSDKENVLAQFKLGNNYGWVDMKGQERVGKTISPHKELGESPLESQLIKNWEFSSKTMNLLIDAKYYPPSGYIITPSYIFDLGFLPAQLPALSVVNYGDMDLDEATFKVKATKSFGKGILAVIVGFFETGPDARDYFVDDQTKLILMDENMQPVSNLTLQNGDDECNTSKEYYKFYGDTLIEIMQGDGLDYPYHSLRGYKYFALDKFGNTTELKTNRFFKYTKFVKIDKNYFYGCYTRSLGFREDAPIQIMEKWKHLSIEDLDFMRNEIFADYGYKFKSKKWQKLFGKYSWYKPMYDNVDEFLTEIDRYNIEVILRMKSIMKGHEDGYLKKETYEDNQAG